MQIGILTIGDELLMGKVLNQNFSYLSKSLLNIGLNTSVQISCRDNEQDIFDALDFLMPKCDFIITSGGLGSTPDDLTKTAIAKYCNLDLEENEYAIKAVDNYYSLRKLPVPKYAYKFKQLPIGCKYIENISGISPGCIVSCQDVEIAILPGPTKELVDMVETQLINYLKLKHNIPFEKATFKLFNVKESEVVLKISDLISKYKKSVQITTYCSTKQVDIVVRYSARVAKITVDNIMSEIMKRFSNAIFSTDETELNEQFVNYLRLFKKRLAVAESLTGGMLADSIVKVPGASEVFYEGLVTYDSMSKVERLGINPNLISDKGVVSKEVAYEMAYGLLKNPKIDLAIATTGNAGPTGKPLGLTYISVGTREKIDVFEHVFNGDREYVRECATKTALYHAIQILNGKININEILK